MGSCPTAEQYLQTGRATRRPDGKLGLPNRQFVPRSIEGQWLKDRLDEYWRRQLGDQTNVNPVTPANPPIATHSATVVLPPPSGTAASMFFGIGPSASQEDVLATKGSFASTVSIQDDEDAQEEIEYYQNQILAIQTRQRTKKMAFDGVEIVKKSAPQPATDTKQKEPSSSRTKASVTSVGKEKKVPAAPTPVPEKPVETKQPASPPTSTPTAPVHPFSKAKDANYLPPVDRNFAAALKPKERDAAYHTSAPIQDSKFVDSVLDRSLKETHIMLSFEELLSLSPDLRYRLCDKVTPKHQTPMKAVHFAGEEPIDIKQIVSPAALQDLEPTRLGPNRYQAPDLVQVFYTAQDHIGGKKKIVLQSKKESLASRSIKMVVENKADIDCILDIGSEIMCMSDPVSHQLGIAYNPNITIDMQSANGTRDPTLGLARNVTFTVGPFELLFQVHIVKSPAYDILLGMPFYDLVGTAIRNLKNEEQTCTLMDPESGEAYTIPTLPRSPPKFTMMRESKDFHKASRN
jgi:hypothetical protein